MPAARVPTASNDWAPAGAAIAATTNATTTTRSIILIRQSLAYERRLARTLWNQRLKPKHPCLELSYCMVLESFVPPAETGRAHPTQTMANTAVQPGAIRTPLSLPARFFGIITSPRATYESVVANPKWFGMLALVAVLMAVVVGGFLKTKVGQEAWLDAATNSPMGGQVSEQQLQGMEKMAPYVGYITACFFLFGTPIFLAVISGILFAVFNAALGGEATFKQVFTVVVHAGPIGLLAQLFTAPLNYARGTMTSASNLGVLAQSMLLGRQSFVGAPARRDRHLPDLAALRPLHRAGGALPPPHAADRDFAVRAVRRHRGDRRLRSTRSWSMSRNKKILVGVAIVLAARRSRVRQLQIQARRRRGSRRPKRSRSVTSRRSCRHPARSRRSATSTSAPTRWAASPSSPSTKATASRRASSCCRSIRATSRRAVQRTEASLAAARSQMPSSSGSRSTAPGSR